MSATRQKQEEQEEKEKNQVARTIYQQILSLPVPGFASRISMNGGGPAGD